jgi:hypothetical protein
MTVSTLIKLHGSINWRDAPDAPGMVMGRRKPISISAHPLRWVLGVEETKTERLSFDADDSANRELPWHHHQSHAAGGEHTLKHVVVEAERWG